MLYVRIAHISIFDCEIMTIKHRLTLSEKVQVITLHIEHLLRSTKSRSTAYQMLSKLRQNTWKVTSKMRNQLYRHLII